MSLALLRHTIRGTLGAPSPPPPPPVSILVRRQVRCRALAAAAKLPPQQDPVAISVRSQAGGAVDALARLMQARSLRSRNSAQTGMVVENGSALGRWQYARATARRTKGLSPRRLQILTEHQSGQAIRPGALPPRAVRSLKDFAPVTQWSRPSTVHDRPIQGCRTKSLKELIATRQGDPEREVRHDLASAIAAPELMEMLKRAAGNRHPGRSPIGATRASNTALIAGRDRRRHRAAGRPSSAYEAGTTKLRAMA